MCESGLRTNKKEQAAPKQPAPKLFTTKSLCSLTYQLPITSHNSLTLNNLPIFPNTQLRPNPIQMHLKRLSYQILTFQPRAR
ncbi:Uncharacterised protein [Cedecea lapagei]|uniref:Uncharacterized protein n=1 Tax=Cedecea lapagei TaxID=158823 RepID=A0A3S4IBU9_9ENTR|nr:Uncharacterised protein [Cedecea lapagei]